MTRIATLLDTYGRPAQRVQILHKAKHTTRIRRPINHGRDWSHQQDKVDSSLILDDGGQLWERHNHNPKHATYLDYQGKPVARLRIHRPYSSIVKARFYLGDNKWSEIDDVSPSQVLYDGGYSAGWTPYSLNLPDLPELPDLTDTPAPPVTAEDTLASALEPAPTPLSAPAPQFIAAQDKPSHGQKVSYLRVSSADQNLARQRDTIGMVDQEFSDHISARSRSNRQGLTDCINYLRAGDTLHVASIDRLARSLVDLKELINQITDKGASVRFIKENLEFSTTNPDPRATLMLGVLGSFAEFERAIIKERQAEGIALAKKAGKYKGRKKALSPAQVEQAHQRVKAGESKVAIAQDLGIGRATLYRALNDLSNYKIS